MMGIHVASGTTPSNPGNTSNCRAARPVNVTRHSQPNSRTQTRQKLSAFALFLPPMLNKGPTIFSVYQVTSVRISRPVHISNVQFDHAKTVMFRQKLSFDRPAFQF